MGPNFPNGAVGAAYLLMRAQAALAALQFTLAVGPVLPWSRPVVGAVIVSLVLGFFTRAAAAAGGVMLLADFVLFAPTLAVAGQAVVMFALTLVGGGAYSVDRLLFGRREIRFRP